MNSPEKVLYQEQFLRQVHSPCQNAPKASLVDSDSRKSRKIFLLLLSNDERSKSCASGTNTKTFVTFRSKKLRWKRQRTITETEVMDAWKPEIVATNQKSQKSPFESDLFNQRFYIMKNAILYITVHSGPFICNNNTQVDM